MGLAMLQSPLIAFGGLAMVGTILMAGDFTNSAQVCASDEPPTCAYFEDAPEDKVLEKRSDNFMAKDKSYTASDVKDFRPEYAYTYEACSSITGTGLMHAGTPVTNQYCLALGCNYKQCIQKRTKCNQDTGAPADDYMDNGTPTPDLFCVAAKLQSSIDPARFTAVILALVVSITMCVMGCVSRRSSD